MSHVLELMHYHMEGDDGGFGRIGEQLPSNGKASRTCKFGSIANMKLQIKLQQTEIVTYVRVQSSVPPNIHTKDQRKGKKKKTTSSRALWNIGLPRLSFSRSPFRHHLVEALSQE